MTCSRGEAFKKDAIDARLAARRSPDDETVDQRAGEAEITYEQHIRECPVCRKDLGH